LWERDGIYLEDQSSSISRKVPVSLDYLEGVQAHLPGTSTSEPVQEQSGKPPELDSDSSEQNSTPVGEREMSIAEGRVV
jgi:hypothetical protein